MYTNSIIRIINFNATIFAQLVLNNMKNNVKPLQEQILIRDFQDLEH